jgi:hypothetical protein
MNRWAYLRLLFRLKEFSASIFGRRSPVTRFFLNRMLAETRK